MRGARFRATPPPLRERSAQAWAQVAAARGLSCWGYCAAPPPPVPRGDPALQARCSSPSTRDCGLRDPVFGPVRAGATRDCVAPRMPVSDPGRAASRSPYGAGPSGRSGKSRAGWGGGGGEATGPLGTRGDRGGALSWVMEVCHHLLSGPSFRPRGSGLRP